MAAALVLIEGIERMNAIVTRNLGQGQQMGQSRRDPNTININRRNNRNCYNYGGFGHMARHCRNRRVGMNRKMEIEDNNLNGDGGLMSPN